VEGDDEARAEKLRQRNKELKEERAREEAERRRRREADARAEQHRLEVEGKW